MGQTILQTTEVAALVKQLPLKLRAGVNVEVLEAALQEGIVSVEDKGHLLWTLESKTLLAYFCGRMWCGDESFYSNIDHARVWRRSEKMFPEKDLAALFGEKNLRTLRKNRDLCPLPCGWEVIDDIFEGF